MGERLYADSSPRRSIRNPAPSCARIPPQATPSRSCRRPRATRSSPGPRPGHRARHVQPPRDVATADHRRGGAAACYGDGKAGCGARLRRQPRHRARQSFFYTDSDEDLPLLEHRRQSAPHQSERRLAAIARQAWLAGRTFTSRGMPTGSELVRTALAVGAACRRSCSAAGGLLSAQLAAGRQPRGHTGASSARARRDPPAGQRRGVSLVASARRCSSSTTRAGSRRSPVQAAAPRLRRHRQAGAPPQSAVRSVLRARRHHVHRPLRPRARRARARARRAGAARGPVDRHRPRGHAQHHRQARRVQEGRVPSRDGGPPADRPDRLPQHPRRAAQARLHRAPGDHRRRVHPPIATDDWTADAIDERIAEVRRLYEETLREWSS